MAQLIVNSARLFRSSMILRPVRLRKHSSVSYRCGPNSFPFSILDDFTDNPLCTSCSVCTASSVSPFEYNCANEFTSADGCVTIGCDGSCGDGGGGTVATSPQTSSSESKPPTPLIIPPLKPTVAPAGSDSGTLSYSTIVAFGLMMSASVFGMFF